MTRLPTLGALLLAATTPSPAEEPWIVFASGRTGDGDVYAIRPSDGETVLVVGTPDGEGTVRYDRARDRIVHHRFLGEKALLVANGEVLFEDPNGDVAPRWSPDGERIVYALRRDDREDLYVADPDGTNGIRLTDDAAIDRYPAWSPDGERIVYARRGEEGWALHVLAADGAPAAPERITAPGSYVGHPAWSPDGRFVAFDTLVDGDAEIAVVELESGEVTRLTERAGNDLIPAWSPDGRRIAFGGEPAGSGNWDLWMIDVETREMVRLTEHPAYDGGPVFVPASALDR